MPNSEGEWHVVPPPTGGWLINTAAGTYSIRDIVITGTTNATYSSRETIIDGWSAASTSTQYTMSTGTGYMRAPVQRTERAPALTEEQADAAEQMRRELLRQRQDEQIRRRAFVERARVERHRQSLRELGSPENQRAAALLPRVLTPAELQHYHDYAELRITVPSGNIYVIKEEHDDGYVGNVRLKDPEDDQTLITYCVHPRERDYAERRLPIMDMWIGQILDLKADEEGTIETANIHAIGPRGAAWLNRHRQAAAMIDENGFAIAG